MCVCVSLASDSLETVQIIIIKLGMLTASDASRVNYIDLDLQSRSHIEIMKINV